jgi:hypothetical protein
LENDQEAIPEQVKCDDNGFAKLLPYDGDFNDVMNAVK